MEKESRIIWAKMDKGVNVNSWTGESHVGPCGVQVAVQGWALGTPALQAHLSASSKMSTSMLLRWKEGQLWRWSMSRPGVAMRMSGAARSAASWDFTSRPPAKSRAHQVGSRVVTVRTRYPEGLSPATYQVSRQVQSKRQRTRRMEALPAWTLQYTGRDGLFNSNCTKCKNQKRGWHKGLQNKRNHRTERVNHPRAERCSRWNQ